jgi:hypothetical protein
LLDCLLAWLIDWWLKKAPILIMIIRSRSTHRTLRCVELSVGLASACKFSLLLSRHTPRPEASIPVERARRDLRYPACGLACNDR